MFARRRSLVFAVFAVMTSVIASADEAYVVRYNRTREVGCARVIWRDGVTFYNEGDQPAVIRVLGVSDGAPATSTPSEFNVPPKHVTMLDDALNGGWQPSNAQQQLWIMRLDIPAGVRVQSRNEVIGMNICLGFVQPMSLGYVDMPVFDSLVPALEAQVHLGSDLGSRASRTNAVVHNASSSIATATVEVRRTCDDSVVERRQFNVPANSTVQVEGLQHGADLCLVGTASPWARYTVVTVDQVSLSIVSNVVNASEGATPFDLFAPRIDLNVASIARRKSAKSHAPTFGLTKKDKIHFEFKFEPQH